MVMTQTVICQLIIKSDSDPECNYDDVIDTDKYSLVPIIELITLHINSTKYTICLSQL